ncbi:unnamed protein product [Caenorhabditis auriculariae]|uniref:Neurotransmitter-gated ion-channel ligand-binding domain-containing protein n=1 Tax=Caenorhabditis auriculariae TaxID=2777116 RepID=A0A8S1H7E1_9PELO|nr:unnamed protein product [Caenorhabditis auriculariae]
MKVHVEGKPMCHKDTTENSCCKKRGSANCPRTFCEPTVVETSVHIEKVANIDFDKQTFEAVLTSEQWLRGVNVTPVRHELMKTDEVFEPLSEISVQAEENVVLPPVHLAFVGDAVVGRKTRHKMSVPCHFDEAFPFDVHNCDVCFLATKSSTDELLLQWVNSGAITVHPRLKIANLYISSVTPRTKTHQVSLPSKYASSSLQRSHSSACVVLQLRRVLSICVIRFFLPSSALFLLATCASFISRSEVTCRILLITVSMLSQLVLVSSFLKTFPSTSTISALDIWILLLIAQYCFFIALELVVIWTEENAKKYKRLMNESSDVREKSRSRHERIASKQLFYREGSKASSCEPPSNVYSTPFRKSHDASTLLGARVQLVERVLLPTIHFFSVAFYFGYYQLISV